MAKPTLTVSLPDGTIAKRQTARAYLFAIVAAPRSAERVVAAYLAAAAREDARADRLAAMIADAKIVHRSRGLTRHGEDVDGGFMRDGHSYHNFETFLTGPEHICWHSDSKGFGEVYSGRERSVVDVAEWILTDYAPGLLAQARESAARNRELAATATADPTYAVLRWTSRQDLAVKALAEFAYAEERGHKLLILPVN